MQEFFLEHTDDIISLAINGGAGFENIIATGQIGKSPIIYIWDATKHQVKQVRPYRVTYLSSCCRLCR